MLKLPLWLDLGSCRVVHAAWDDESVKSLGTQDTLTKRNLAKVGDRLTPEGKAVNFLLKGPEYKLGDGTLFVDKQGFARTSVRAKWWIPIRPGMTHAEAAMPAGKFRGKGGVPEGLPSRLQSHRTTCVLWPLLVGSLKPLRPRWPQMSRVWTTAPVKAGRWSPIGSTASES